MFRSPQSLPITFKRESKLAKMECRSHISFLLPPLTSASPSLILHALLQPSDYEGLQYYLPLCLGTFCFFILGRSPHQVPLYQISCIPPSMLNQDVFFYVVFLCLQALTWIRCYPSISPKDLSVFFFLVAFFLVSSFFSFIEV